MLFLWNFSSKSMIHKTQSPSPKRKNKPFWCGFIERASLLISLKRTVAAAMTVEAALVLPLFVFFFVNLGSAIEVIRLHGNLQLALWDSGNRMCVYGYVSESAKEEASQAEEEQRSVWEEMSDIALTYTYVKGQVVDYVGSDYLEESPLCDGADGLQFWESDVGTLDAAMSGDILDIVMTYQVSPLLDIPYVRPFRMVNRYYGRLWTGYDVTASDEKGMREDIVYVAEHAQVYHESATCTHLKLTIYEVTMVEALKARNENGGKYTQCSKCKDKKLGATVFIAKEGDFYHRDKGCSGLKRTIFTMLRELAVEKYRPCSRCSE